jgi:hypothetical protein
MRKELAAKRVLLVNDDDGDDSEFGKLKAEYLEGEGASWPPPPPPAGAGSSEQQPWFMFTEQAEAQRTFTESERQRSAVDIAKDRELQQVASTVAASEAVKIQCEQKSYAAQMASSARQAERSESQAQVAAQQALQQQQYQAAEYEHHQRQMAAMHEAHGNGNSIDLEEEPTPVSDHPALWCDAAVKCTRGSQAAEEGPPCFAPQILPAAPCHLLARACWQTQLTEATQQQILSEKMNTRHVNFEKPAVAAAAARQQKQLQAQRQLLEQQQQQQQQVRVSAKNAAQNRLR